MKNIGLFSFLSLITLLLSAPAFSQPKGKKEAKWQDSICHVWGLDSSFRYDDDGWKKRDEEDTGTRVCFYQGGAALLWNLADEEQHPFVTQYDLLSGMHARYLNLGFESMMKIERLDATNLVLVTEDRYSRGRIHLSKKPAEKRVITHWVQGDYCYLDREFIVIWTGNYTKMFILYLFCSCLIRTER